MTFQTDVRLSRQKQINTLAVFNELVECVVEGAEYRIQFRSSEQQQLTVCVKLPPDFPAAQPHVFIEPPVFHPWVQLPTGRVSQAPGLLNFSPHSDLGMVVQAIRREFEKCESLQVVPQPRQNTSSSQQQQPNPTDPVQARLADMTREELQEVLDNEVALEKLVCSLAFPPLDCLTANIPSMEEVVRLTAQRNMALQEEIEASRDNLLCKVEEYHTKKLALGQVQAKVKSLAARVEGPVLAEQLLRLSVQNEEKSDAIADKFLARELPVEEFLAQYIQTRQESHSQKLKADKVKPL